MAKPTIRYPGVYVEETRTTVKVIPGVAIDADASQITPSRLLGAGYKIVQSRIEPAGLAILFGKGAEHILVRMSDYRDGSTTDGHMVVTFTGKLP
jgi:hypothetical protein